MRTKIAILVLIMTASFKGSALAYPPSTPPTGTYQIKVTSDIRYGTGATSTGPMALLLDLYEPLGGLAGGASALLAMHGGGFHAGDKTNPIMADICRDLASRGMLCVSIDYRLETDDPSTTGPTPRDRAIMAAIEDASLAGRWLVANAGALRLDPSKISFGGSSAGAGTALMAAYMNARNAPVFSAVVDLWGSLAGNEDVINANESPLIIFHGTADPKVPFADAVALDARATQVGLAHEFVPIVGGGHANSAVAVIGAQVLHDKIADFLYRYNFLTPTRPVSIPSPAINFYADPVPGGTGYSLIWNAVNVSACQASGTGWKGSKPLFGSRAINAYTAKTYTLNCGGSMGSVTRSLTVSPSASH